MKPYYFNMKKALSCALLLAPTFAFAFSSGSTGADGAFNPTVNTQLQLPPNGIFNFTSVNIPVGVTVTFKKNATNTPVVMLSSADITIAGNLQLNGTKSADTGAAGNGNQGDDGLPGLGGPGSYDGGRGGKAGRLSGGTGLGPGAGGIGTTVYSNAYPSSGGGGSFGTAGTAGWNYPGYSGAAGATYGSSLLLPLIGGSGGGGGMGGDSYEGSGGGGGGGAILLAASGTVTVSGAVSANGGASGDTNSGGNIVAGGSGGGGSGGAVRIIASTIAGNGSISAAGGAAGATYAGTNGGAGGAGRIRLEADTITRNATTNPAFTTDAPGPIFVAGLPTLTIDSVAGVAAPANPTGSADITLPATTANPVTVVFKTANVPVGNTVKLTLTPAYGAPVTAVTPALTGTTESATASISIALPAGPSVLQAQTTYTIVASLGDAMRNFAGNERVERIELIAALNGRSSTNLITVSGKRYEATPEALATLGRMPVFAALGS